MSEADLLPTLGVELAAEAYICVGLTSPGSRLEDQAWDTLVDRVRQAVASTDGDPVAVEKLVTDMAVSLGFARDSQRIMREREQRPARPKSNGALRRFLYG